MIHKILFTIAFLAISHSQFSQTYNWANLPAAPTNGSKQDGIYFVNKDYTLYTVPNEPFPSSQIIL